MLERYTFLWRFCSFLYMNIYIEMANKFQKVLLLCMDTFQYGYISQLIFHILLANIDLLDLFFQKEKLVMLDNKCKIILNFAI